jgi:hypothetical protein
LRTFMVVSLRVLLDRAFKRGQSIVIAGTQSKVK